MEEIRFDDIAGLQAKVSDQFGAWSDPIDVTQDMIDRFAELTGDHQWIHVDVERAKKESPFGRTIAHGFLTLSLLPELSKTAFAVDDVRMGINYGLNKVRFPAPVKSGARLRGRFRLTAFDPLPGGAQLTVEVTMEVEGGDKPVCVAESLSRRYTQSA